MVSVKKVTPEQRWIRSLTPRASTDPRTLTIPMNERGLRVRFIPWSESAIPTQQDRLRKCSLTSVSSPNCTDNASPRSGVALNELSGATRYDFVIFQFTAGFQQVRQAEDSPKIDEP
jgi:hypothetical protein